MKIASCCPAWAGIVAGLLLSVTRGGEGGKENVRMAADLDIAPKKATVRATNGADGELVLDIECPGGIGGAVIGLKSGEWSQSVLLRLHLRGLESLRVSNGTIALGATVSSHGDNAVRVWRIDNRLEQPIEKGSPYWMPIRAFDPSGQPGKQVPLDKGYLEIALPQALFEQRPKTIEIHWIDFYRD